MKATTGENVVALYWDFENIHASLLEATYGPHTYATSRFRPQDPVVNIKLIMDYAATIGVMAINRAYSNWQSFARYRDDLNQHGLDLIQQFPRGMKNGADIRLALDVLEDLHHFPHITHVIIVGSDSDYISLAQKVKQSGRRIIGIGVQENANPFWVQCCNEFKFYHTLLNRADGVQRDIDDHTGDRASLEDARKLITEAVQRLRAQYGEQNIPRAALKILMLRIDPSFDEANYNFPTFSAFVDTFPDLVENHHNDSGGYIRMVGDDGVAHTGDDSNGNVPVYAAGGEHAYATILKRGNVRPLPVTWWRPALLILGQIFAQANHHRFSSFDDLKQAFAARLHQHGIDDDPGLINKLRINLIAMRQFVFFGEGGGIALQPQLGQDGTGLLRSVEQEMVRRIVRFGTPPIDELAVVSLVFGEQTADTITEARRLIAEVAGVDSNNDL